MSIKIPNGLPAARTLAGENIFVMDETRAVSQDIRPLQILVLNLMPTKIETETQLSRLLGNTPLQVELEFLHTSSHESKNTSREHLFKFYQVFDQVRDRNFDGMVITGHSEYDPGTLQKEYLRDKNAGLPIHVPENYFPDDDDTQPPRVTWRSHANLLYLNWLNYFVYQGTLYDLDTIEPVFAGL